MEDNDQPTITCEDGVLTPDISSEGIPATVSPTKNEPEEGDSDEEELVDRRRRKETDSEREYSDNEGNEVSGNENGNIFHYMYK